MRSYCRSPPRRREDPRRRRLTGMCPRRVPPVSQTPGQAGLDGVAREIGAGRAALFLPRQDRGKGDCALRHARGGCPAQHNPTSPRRRGCPVPVHEDDPSTDAAAALPPPHARRIILFVLSCSLARFDCFCLLARLGCLLGRFVLGSAAKGNLATGERTNRSIQSGAGRWLFSRYIKPRAPPLPAHSIHSIPSLPRFHCSVLLCSQLSFHRRRCCLNPHSLICGRGGSGGAGCRRCPAAARRWCFSASSCLELRRYHTTGRCRGHVLWCKLARPNTSASF
uniref:Uncharacterized protein n=1 Tax=Setaria italica TaxID=4555 RepID=K3YUT6_SETIT